MNRTLGNRHLQLAHHAEFTRTMPIDILEKSIARVWTHAGYADSSRDHLDFEAAISGDDLARINAFEPKDPDLRSIGRQHGIWSSPRVVTGKPPVPGRRLMTMNDENETTPSIEDHI